MGGVRGYRKSFAMLVKAFVDAGLIAFGGFAA